MFFKQTQNKIFPSGFFISDNRIFAIGIVSMAIQVLSKIGAHWAIVEEYKTVDENVKREWLAKILKSLEPVMTKDSDVVKKVLPKMKEKQQIKDVDTNKIAADKVDANKMNSNSTNKEKKYEQHGHRQKSTRKFDAKFQEEKWEQKGKDV